MAQSKKDKEAELEHKKDNNSRAVKELNDLAKEFEKDFGEQLAMKANLCAINRMLISRMQASELLNEFKSVTTKFKEKSDETEA